MLAQLSEDEKIRMQCEARKDNLAIEKGLYNRGVRESKAFMCAELGLPVENISKKLSISVDKVKEILSQ